MSRGRLLLAAAVVVLLGGVGYFVWQDRQAAANCESVTQARDELLADPITDGAATVAVIGDSYTQGTGLDGPELAWPVTLGEDLGATVTVDGMGSTGFTTPGYCEDDAVRYGERLAADRPQADVVVVQGGVNDALTGEPKDIAATAADVLDQLVDAGTVVVVGPPDVPAADDEDLRTIDVGLRSATEDAGRVYVSLLSEHVELLDDGVHPTEDGQRRIAELVAAAIR